MVTAVGSSAVAFVHQQAVEQAAASQTEVISTLKAIVLRHRASGRLRHRPSGRTAQERNAGEPRLLDFKFSNPVQHDQATSMRLVRGDCQKSALVSD